MKIHPYVFVGLETNIKTRIRSSKKLYVNTDEILNIISEEQSISIDSIISRVRHREVVSGRQLFCYIMREKFGFSYSKIGRLIERNHATIMHSNKSHKDNYQFDREYRNMCDKVLKRVYEVSTTF
jgi:chromosomal replication initiation ATPase DnaA